ncbi:hypothetical protein, partial [Corynebacterium sp. HMSC076C10]|uniref:hypothetical protein n=1 Tax=Corynebacterium sp. HMSC076C10 TaxID=1739361 RepID=UPI001AEFC397
ATLTSRYITHTRPKDTKPQVDRRESTSHLFKRVVNQKLPVLSFDETQEELQLLSTKSSVIILEGFSGRMYSLLSLTVRGFPDNDFTVVKIPLEFILQSDHVGKATDEGIIFTDNDFVLPIFNGVEHIWVFNRQSAWRALRAHPPRSNLTLKIVGLFGARF